MAWIELHQTVKKHRKTLRLSSLLGVSRREALGLLCDLWLWAIDNADKNGLLEGLTAEDIGMALDMKRSESLRTISALLDSGYLVETNGQYVIHDWYDYCGKLNDKRASDRQRKAESRQKSASIPTDVHRTSNGSPLVTVPNLTVHNQVSSLRSDTESTKGAAAPAPTRAKHGQFGWVRLTGEEYGRLTADLGEKELARCIAYVDESAQLTGNKNKWKDWNQVLRRCSRNKWGFSVPGGPGAGKHVGFQAYEQGDDEPEYNPNWLIEEARGAVAK